MWRPSLVARKRLATCAVRAVSRAQRGRSANESCAQRLERASCEPHNDRATADDHNIDSHAFSAAAGDNRFG
jgi:hypothetical protein